MASTSTPRRGVGQDTRGPLARSPYNDSSPEASTSAYIPADSPISAADMLSRARKRRPLYSASRERGSEPPVLRDDRPSTPSRQHKTRPSIASLLSSPEREAAVRASLRAASEDHNGLELSRELLRAQEVMGPPTSTPMPKRGAGPTTSTPRIAAGPSALRGNGPSLFSYQDMIKHVGNTHTPLASRRRERSESASSLASSTSSTAAELARQRQRAFAAWGGAREESPMDLLRRLASAPGFLPTPGQSATTVADGQMAHTPRTSSTRQRDTTSPLASLARANAGQWGNKKASQSAATPRQSDVIRRSIAEGNSTRDTSEAGLVRRASRYSIPENPFANFAEISEVEMANDTTKDARPGQLSTTERDASLFPPDSAHTLQQMSSFARSADPALLDESTTFEREIRNRLDGNVTMQDTEEQSTLNTIGSRTSFIQSNVDRPLSQLSILAAEQSSLERTRTTLSQQEETTEERIVAQLEDQQDGAQESFAFQNDAEDGFPSAEDVLQYDQTIRQTDGDYHADDSPDDPREALIDAGGVQDSVVQQRRAHAGRISDHGTEIVQAGLRAVDESDHQRDEDDSFTAASRKELNAARMALLRKRRVHKRQQRIAPLTGQSVPPLPSSLVRDLFCTLATPSVGVGLGGSALPSILGRTSSKAKVERTALEAVEDLSHHFFAQFSRELVLQSEHKPSPSTRITEEDIAALLRAQGHVTQRHSLVSLARKYLPRELSDLIVAGSGSNAVGESVKDGRDRGSVKREASTTPHPPTHADAGRTKIRKKNTPTSDKARGKKKRSESRAHDSSHNR